MPTSVVTGLFLFMGVESLLDGDIFARLVFPFVQKHRWYLLHFDDRLKKDDFLKIHRSSVNIYTLIQMMAFGIVFYVTQTVASIAFPAFILLLVPLRFNVLPRFKKYFAKEFIDIIDQPLIEDSAIADKDLEDGMQEVRAETPSQASDVPAVPDLVKAFHSPCNAAAPPQAST